jgi:hypothetical protein
MNTDPADYYPSLSEDKLDKLDLATKTRYLHMLGAVPEPIWENVCVRMIAALKQIRDDLAAQPDEVIMKASSVSILLDHMLRHPLVGGAAYDFLDHTLKSMDVIMLEQMLKEE